MSTESRRRSSWVAHGLWFAGGLIVAYLLIANPLEEKAYAARRSCGRTLRSRCEGLRLQ